MASYPRTLVGEEITRELRVVIEELTTRLLAGDEPMHAVLRDQYKLASLRSVKLTGAGFFANFDVPHEASLVAPPRILGGNVQMTVDGMPEGAGSLIGVEDGRLSFIEVYIYGTLPWTENTVVQSYDDGSPVRATEPRSSSRGAT
jgi:hypothetical protein